jgi:competence protein ComEC
MQPIPLFVNKKEFFVFMGAVFCIAFFSLSIEFYRYMQLKHESLHVTKATVLNHYQKTNEKGRTYDVFKLRLDKSGAEVYTTTWHSVNADLQSRVKVKLKVDKVGFIDYLKGFYAPNLALYTIYEDHPPWNPKALYRWVENQHEDEEAKALYKTLFFAAPLPKELRDSVQVWGVSHLVAISGYHIGIISFLLFFLLRPLYRFFQARYFPYRNATADLSIVVFSVLFLYMIVIDFTPSYVRAFGMSVFGFFFFSRGIKLLSFEVLGLTVLGLIAFFPSLFFSLSFWFSVAGVFYLFLIVHHFEALPKWLLFIVIDAGIFILMLPVVHRFFPLFTFLQLSTPLTSLLFIGFYPLSFMLHLLNLGSFFDPYLVSFLHVSVSTFSLSFPVWFVGAYIVLSLLAIRFRFCLMLCALSAIGGSLFLIQ